MYQTASADEWRHHIRAVLDQWRVAKLAIASAATCASCRLRPPKCAVGGGGARYMPLCKLCATSDTDRLRRLRQAQPLTRTDAQRLARLRAATRFGIGGSKSLSRPSL